MISSAYVDIMIVKERKEDSKTLQSLEIIWSEVHTMTPYKFAMGGKISKKAMLESLEYIKSKGIDVD